MKPNLHNIIPLTDIAPEMPLNRDDEQGLIFGADEIARLVKECHRRPATTIVDSDGEDE